MNAMKLFDKLLADYTDRESTEKIATLASYFFGIILLSLNNVVENNVQDIDKVLHVLSLSDVPQYLLSFISSYLVDT